MAHRLRGSTSLMKLDAISMETSGGSRSRAENSSDSQIVTCACVPKPPTSLPLADYPSSCVTVQAASLPFTPLTVNCCRHGSCQADSAHRPWDIPQ